MTLVKRDLTELGSFFQVTNPETLLSFEEQELNA